MSHRQRKAPYFENSTANARPRVPAEPVMSTISSLIDFFGAGNIEKTIARVNLNETNEYKQRLSLDLRHDNTIETLKETNRRHDCVLFNK